MMRDDAAAGRGAELLRVDDFYLPAHAALFSLLLDMRRGGLELDPAIVQEEMRKRNLLRQIGEGVLGEVLESGRWAGAYQIESFCEQLRHLAASRAAIVGSMELGVAAESSSPSELASRAHGIGDAIEARAQADKDPLKELFEDLDDAVSGRTEAVPLPWDKLSEDTQALLPGTVTILCGSPGATKSFARIQVVRRAVNQGFSACSLALEDKASYDLRRAAAQMHGEPGLTNNAWCHANASAVGAIKRELGARLEKFRPCFEAPNDINRVTADDVLDWLRSRSKANRVLTVDPITLIARGDKAWVSDESFLGGAKRIVEKSGSSLFLVTHPRKMPFGAKVSSATMDDLAGGAVYARAAQTILYLIAHDEKELDGQIQGPGSTYNRTVIVFKARNGRGVEGCKYAFQFNQSNLSLEEVSRMGRR